MWQRPESKPNPPLPRTGTLLESDPGHGGSRAENSALGDSAPNASSLRATEPGAGREPAAPRSGQRFTHASGSRPLDGFTIKRGIGAGGFGEVYYALSDGGKEVALKLIRRNLEIELRGISHCLNLKHPNLLGLYDIKQDSEGDTWVVMEYVSGECLSDVLASHPQGLPLDEALSWIHGIAAGAAYLHDRGIVHRDLKPGNVFCDEGVVKIGDYGLSKFISVSRRSGQTESVGTVHYMAPEVGNGRYGKGIDIYALGVIFYELLTGEVPFEGESVGEVLMKHLTAQPDLARVPEAYRAAVSRCLEKDPERRLQSVSELLALLPAPPNGPVRTPVQSVASIPPIPMALAGSVGESPAVRHVAGPSEEPIQRWLIDTWRELSTAWQRADLNLFLRAVVILAAVIAVFASSSIWIPLVLTYAVYRGVRALYLAYSAPKSQGRPPLAQPVVPPPVPAPRGGVAARPAAATPAPVGPTRERRSSRRHRREKAHSALLVKTPREWRTELVGSLLLGPPLALAMSILAAVVYAVFWKSAIHANELAWVALTAALGTWMVLVPGKFWEGTDGDPWLRRLVMLFVGAGLGAVACVLAQVFLVDVRANPQSPVIAVGLFPGRAFGVDGALNLIPFMTYFAAVMAVPSWWKLADPRRESRLSLWSVAWVTFVAYIVGEVTEYPVHWALLPVVVVALAVQLSAAWMDGPHSAQQAA